MTNLRQLTRSMLVLALGGTVACGGTDDAGDGDPGSSGAQGGRGTSSGNKGGNGGGGSTNGAGGDGSGEAGSGGKGGGGDGGSGGTIGAGGSSATPPPTFPLLVVATSQSVKVWQNADQAATGDAPSFELTVELGEDGYLGGVVATRERVGVVSSEGLLLFDEPGALDASSTPTAIIPPTAFSGGELGGFDHQFVDAQGDLWLTYGQGRIALLKDFNLLTASSEPSAEFTHEWEQLASAAYYAPDDILFGAQVSGAGLLYYSNAKTRTGVTVPDGAFDSFTGWGSAVLGNSLFAGWASELGVWHDLDADSSARAPDSTLSDSGLYLDAAADAVVIATDSGSVDYFASASSLGTGSEPDTLYVAPLLHGIDLASNGQTLATVGADQAYLIDHGPGGLSLRAALPLGDAHGNDVSLVE